MSKVDGALSALRDAIEALENLLAAAEPAKGHSALRTGLDLRLAQSTYDVLVARARMAGLFGSSWLDYLRIPTNPATWTDHSGRGAERSDAVSWVGLRGGRNGDRATHLAPGAC